MSEDLWDYKRKNSKTGGWFDVVNSNEDLKDVELSRSEDLRKELNEEQTFESHEIDFMVRARLEYDDYYSNVDVPKNLDTANPKELEAFVTKKLQQKENVSNRIDIDCYKTAGAMAAILDKKNQVYECYMGLCLPKGKESHAEWMGAGTNHMWIESGGKVYETFPGHSTEDIGYRKAYKRILFTHNQ